MNSITFTLPLPPSVNAMYRNVPRRGRVKTGAYRAWIVAAIRAIEKQNPPKLAKPYAVHIWLHVDYRSDISNRIKAIEDILTLKGVISDDRWIENVTAQRKELDGTECRVTVFGGWVP